MPIVESSITIAATPEALFALTQDYNRRLDWDPFLKEARLVGGAREAGLGVRSWCVAHTGMGMEAEYVSFRPPYVVAVKMTSGPAVLDRFAGSWRFTALDHQHTQVTFRYSLTARPAFLRRLLDPLLRLIFQRDIEARLRSLKHAVDTKPALLESGNLGAQPTRTTLYSPS